MLRWIVGVLLIALDFLLWITALAALPQDILGQMQYLGSLDENVLVRLVALMLALGVALIAIGPAQLREWRRAAMAREPRVPDQQNNEESDRCVDNRSVSSSGQMGGQTAWSITNQGPQPRDISQPTGEELVTALRKHAPEDFQISWMMDAESSELGAMLQGFLEQGGWRMTMQVPGAMLAGGPPRGVIVETTANSEAVNTFVSWLEQVNLSPQVNKGEQEFRILMMEDEVTPPPTHIVVGVVPR